MASKARGRGYAASKGAQDTELRRPGEAGLLERFGIASQGNAKKSEEPQGSPVDVLAKPKAASSSLVNPAGSTRRPSPPPANKISKPEIDEFSNLCDKMAQMDLTLPKTELDIFAEELKAICKTPGELERCADSLFHFALKSKWNAHAVAVFCNSHGDITVDQTKLRNLLFKRLQGHYIERNKAYLELDKFLLNVTFACEIFHHVHVAGMCLKVLAHPLLDYFGMLVDGASPKEIEVFIEQFPKCYKNLKEIDSDGLNDLLTKIRKQIISETTTITVRAMLLEVFELVLTDWKDLNASAKILYETLSKPIIRICD